MRTSIGLGLMLAAFMMSGLPWLKGDLATVSRTLALSLPLAVAGLGIVLVQALSARAERPEGGLPPRRRRRAF